MWARSLTFTVIKAMTISSVPIVVVVFEGVGGGLIRKS